MTYLARITECEHGFTKDVCGYPIIEGRDDDGGYLTDFCPGGTTTRIELRVAAALNYADNIGIRCEGSPLNGPELRRLVDAALGGTE
jgi:hypothetical protein